MTCCGARRQRRSSNSGMRSFPTYGIGTDLSRKQWRQVARQLLHKGFMTQDPEIGGLSLTPKAWDVCKGKEAVLGRLDVSEEVESTPEDETQSVEIQYDPRAV
ncbi:MAG: hypothetical protein M0C28_05050 [Candidatus Moduliflexus flocculans]|nr:hypothetical protein [Candidatus Moduliflexus flocculans]